MPLPERVCVECGKQFTLLPKKPGLANTCPQCSVPVPETEMVERKPRRKREKTADEIISDLERRKRRHQKLMDLISPKGNRS
jgi:DNA-directed RNA polymerase subunit RPC12/RpoP